MPDILRRRVGSDDLQPYRVEQAAWILDDGAPEFSAVSGSSDGEVLAQPAEKEGCMLYTLAVILLVMWLLGMVSGYTIGAFIHVLLVIAVVLVLVQLITGRRTTL